MSTRQETPGPPAVNRPTTGQPPKLLDRVREALRVRHYSLRTEEAYLAWIKRYIFFHGVRHPAEMGAAQINQFLTDLAVNGHVSASTQNQAFAALLFLYQKVLEVDPGQIAGVIRAKRPRRLPVVLTRAEVRAVLGALEGTPHLVSLLLYGAGLRILDALRLRVHDLEFTRHEMLVRDGKGQKDRVTVLPLAAEPGLRRQLEAIRALYEQDRRDGVGVG